MSDLAISADASRAINDFRERLFKAKLPEDLKVASLSDDELLILTADEQVMKAVEKLKHSSSITRNEGRLYLHDRGILLDAEVAPPVRPYEPTLKLTTQIGTPGKVKAEPPKPRPVMVSAEDVEPEEVNWLWPGRIPRGKVSILMGEPGKGKSTFLSWLCASLTAGSVWPDSGTPIDPGSVIVIQSEESIATDVRPRLDALGADTSKVHFLTGVQRGDREPMPFSLATDMSALLEAVDAYPDLHLIVIDPIGSFLSGINVYNDTEVRQQLDSLFKLAEREDIAILFVSHLNKDGEKDILNRASNSGAFVQMARMVWYLSTDPKREDRRMISLVKGNPYDATKTGLSFGLDSRRRIHWDRSAIPMTAQEVDDLLKEMRRMKREKTIPGPAAMEAVIAEQTIIRLLANGPVLQTELQKLAFRERVNSSTFRRALKRLIHPDLAQVLRSKERPFTLRLPEVATPCGRPISSGDLGDAAFEAQSIATWEDDGGMQLFDQS